MMKCVFATVCFAFVLSACPRPQPEPEVQAAPSVTEPVVDQATATPDAGATVTEPTTAGE